MSTHAPSQSNFQPWYTQRRPSPSLRPKKSEAPRCGQWFWMSPTRPEVARKATRFSPSSRTRTGAPSASGSSAETSAGIQYSRSSAPIGLPGPTRQSSSLSSPESMARLLRSVPPALLVEPDLLVEHLELGLIDVVLHPGLGHLVEG